MKTLLVVVAILSVPAQAGFHPHFHPAYHPVYRPSIRPRPASKPIVKRAAPAAHPVERRYVYSYPWWIFWTNHPQHGKQCDPTKDDWCEQVEAP